MGTGWTDVGPGRTGGTGYLERPQTGNGTSEGDVSWETRR